MSKRLFDSFQPLKPPLWDQYCTVLWPNSHPNSGFYSLSNYFPTSRISATVWMNPSPLHGTTSGTMKFGVPAFIAFKPLRWPSTLKELLIQSWKESRNLKGVSKPNWSPSKVNGAEPLSHP